MEFVDELQIQVASGKGGPGSVSFRRESHVPRGGPDGGDGGRGGSIIFRGSNRISTLYNLQFQRNYAAENGRPGGGQRCTGASGKDLIVELPLGTLVKDSDGHTLLDVTEEKEYPFLSGGRGGLGNWRFRSSINQAPDRAQPGEPGQSQSIQLELKLLADVGVIGFPNVGKSSLVATVSAARPKIANYEFTTLSPSLGVVGSHREERFAIADLPGLIPGAYKGVGLGDRFLRHIERTRIFIHVVDAGGFSGRNPLEDYKQIIHELEKYDDSRGLSGHRQLQRRPQIVVLNKMDLCSREHVIQLTKQFSEKYNVAVRPISVATRFGIQELIHAVGNCLVEYKRAQGL